MWGRNFSSIGPFALILCLCSSGTVGLAQTGQEATMKLRLGPRLLGSLKDTLGDAYDSSFVVAQINGREDFRIALKEGRGNITFTPRKGTNIVHFRAAKSVPKPQTGLERALGFNPLNPLDPFGAQGALTDFLIEAVIEAGGRSVSPEHRIDGYDWEFEAAPRQTIEAIFDKNEKNEYGLTTQQQVGASEPIKIGEIRVNRDQIEKEASSETVESLAGVVTEFKKSRTITREATYALRMGASAEAQAKLAANLLVVKQDLQLRIKGSIERETGERLADSETREQTVRIDGNVVQKAKIVWIDTYKTGTVDVIQDGQVYSVPFRFPIGTKLVIRKW
jgi:hypothetical protein